VCQGVIKILQRLTKWILYRFDILRGLLSGKTEEELDDHLTAINENTNEIQANYEYLCELDMKIEKLTERIDEVCMFMGLQKRNSVSQENGGLNLTRKEQEVFMVLYTQDEEKGSTYQDVAAKLSMSENLVMNYITNIIEKGVPVVKRYVNSEVFLNVDPRFKHIQTTKNVLQISEVVSARVIS
jgi:hypothetical protein